MPAQEKPATNHASAAEYCGYCGHQLSGVAPASERFGQRFCSEAHAEQFVEGVRAARIQGAAHAQASDGVCALPPAGKRTWKNYLKRGACWGVPLLLLLALPLFWSGGTVAAAGGSLLSVLGLLACPLGMYFMMRAMGNMSRRDDKRTPATTTDARDGSKGEH